ncbi:MAG: hypothetical protein JNJ73_14210 [Hyphomonadaceae bacterium]|nr:hypothetical protein [Hyphomonadaceae bacterium]
MAELLVAHAPEAAARAQRVVSKLERSGFKVSQEIDLRAPRKALRSAVGKAEGVLVLWSREAPETLRTVAAAAKDAGKLAVARLDGAAPPALLRVAAIDLSSLATRGRTRSWARLMKSLPKPGAAAPRRAMAGIGSATKAASEAAETAPKRQGFVWVFLLGLAVTAAAAAGAWAMLR